MEATNSNNIDFFEQPQTNLSENKGNFGGRGRGGYRKNVIFKSHN